MPESVELVKERGKLLLLQWDSFPRCCALLCRETVIDSTGNSFFIKTRILTIWYKDSRSVSTNYVKI